MMGNDPQHKQTFQNPGAVLVLVLVVGCCLVFFDFGLVGVLERLDFGLEFRPKFESKRL